MIHGYHVILAAYGFWLPNDPRGSWSDFVGKWELVRFGKTTKPHERRQLVELTDAELRQREAARQALKYPPVTFDGPQARGIGRGFARKRSLSGYTIWACSILPEHTHLVIARHTYKVERIANLLKGAATRQLIEEGRHPLSDFAEDGQRPPRMWAGNQWIVYLDTEDAIEQAIEYVADNPRKEGRPVQRWDFVTRFAGLDPGWVTYH
jgi:REP element-mobilizing transposase RayT